MKTLRWTFLWFLVSVTFLLPSAAVGQSSSATHSKNYANCLYGRYGCDPAQLTADEKEAVAKSAHERNYQNCLHGRSGCDSTHLTTEEKEAIAQAGQKQPSAQTPTSQNGLSNDNYYTNSDGNRVHSPAYSDTVPAGAKAQCRDGSYSFSQHRQGTCSHHGGVGRWL